MTTTHAAPVNGPGAVADPMPCCGLTPLEAAMRPGHQDDEVTVDEKAVTCRGPETP
jgi:hypothetical protein